MAFNSTIFLFYFLPVSLLLYLAVPGPLKNAALLLESAVFLAWSNPLALAPVLALTLLNYALALLIGRCRRRGSAGLARGLLALCVLLDIGGLCVCRFPEQAMEFLRRLSLGQGLTVQSLQVLGISYFTFKLVSYAADVTAGRVEPEKNPVDFAAYALMYPHLTVGPIARYRDLAGQLHTVRGRVSLDMLGEGAEQFVIGLAKKAVLADGIGRLWAGLVGDSGSGLAFASTGLVWLGLAAFSLQLYLDFSGYSEMSIGLCRMMGFSCSHNFDHPYEATSLSVFWRKWHISLSLFFRDYIYIPLGGSRRGVARQIAAMLAVWLATGLWHGVSGAFVLWGLFHFFFLLLEKYALRPLFQERRAWQHVYTLLLVMIGWAFFAAGSGGFSPMLLFSRMFAPVPGTGPLYALRNNGVLLAVGALCSTSLPSRLWRRIRQLPLLSSLLLTLLLLVCVAYVVAGTNAAALYAAF